MFCFWHYAALEIVTYVMSNTGYTPLVKILLKCELIKAHLSLFKLFPGYLGLLIWPNLGLFWAHIGSFWTFLGPFELI